MAIRVAFVTTYDARDVRYWSGTPYYMSRALEAVGLNLTYVGPLRKWVSPAILARWLYHRRYTHQNYHTDREPFVTQAYARQVQAALRSTRPHIVLSPSTLPIARLRSFAPIVFWTDATFDGMINYYPEWTNLAATTLKNGHRTEQEALSNSALAIFSSEWARHTVLQHYCVREDDVRVVLFGANLDGSPDRNEIRSIIKARPHNVCRLLFSGQQWHRKGGDIAISVAQQLRERGVNAELTIVGCEPPGVVPHFVRVAGFISKATAAGRAAIADLYASAHFCLVPSRAECLAVVIAESAAFGLPVVASDVGGHASAITHDVNGALFSLRDYASRAVEYIQDLNADRVKYENLAMAAFENYHERLNWRSASLRVKQMLAEIV